MLVGDLDFLARVRLYAVLGLCQILGRKYLYTGDIEYRDRALKVVDNFEASIGLDERRGL